MTEERLRYGSDLPTIGSARPPGEGAVARVRDVLLVRGDPTAEQGDHDSLVLLPRWVGSPGRGNWSEPEPVDLGSGVRLEKLEYDEAELVLTACSPRGHFFVPVRQFGQMYTFVVDVDQASLDEQRWAWDTDQRLSEALAMSRLVLDNGYSFEYAARIFDYSDGEQQIMPASIGSRRLSYRLRPVQRDWLTRDETCQLRELLGVYRGVKGDLPERVRHALWLAEYMVSVRWLDVIAPLLVVAFESLVNTGKQLVSRQFEERVPALTAAAGAPLSKSLCSSMYDARSRWLHGERVSLYRRASREGEPWEGPTDDEQRAALERVAKTQAALRAVIRTCINDSEFRASFRDSAAIRARWPVLI